MEKLRLILILLLFSVSSAQASVIFQIERYSDYVGVLSGAGNVDRAFVFNAHILAIDAPIIFGSGYNSEYYTYTICYDLWPYSCGGAGMDVGLKDIDFIVAATAAADTTGTGETALYFGDAASPTDYLEGQVSGSLAFDLRWSGTDAIFAPVGTTGTVFNGAACTGCGGVVEIGTWKMVTGVGPAPNLPLYPKLIAEPSTVALFGLGLAGLAGLRGHNT